MSTTPSPEIWNNILKDNVEKDDPLWKEYLDKAAVFDARIMDEWNNIVDVLLVFVALFISVLTPLIANTTQSQRNPTDITNDLLVAIYKQQVAQSNNISIPSVDPTSYFNQSAADYDAAIAQNMLLYSSLSLSITVSVIALAAKLWLVSYSRQAFSVGSPYDRAMKRQEAYNGVLLWKMGGVINMLAIMLLIAVYLFGFYVYVLAWQIEANIGRVTGGLVSIGVMFLCYTSLGAAFVSGCPFRSTFSDYIRLVFEKLRTLSKRIPCGCLSSKRLRWLWIGTSTLLWVTSHAAVAYATLISGTWFALFFLLAGFPVAYSTQQEAAHKPQNYKISRLAALLFLFVSLSMIVAIALGNPGFIPLYIIGMLGIIFAFWMISKVSKSMADTGEIDAIAWLLLTTPPQYPATFFKKAGQMIGLDSIGRHYRPRLLESLMPLLTPLITSYRATEHHSSDTHPPQSDDVLNGRPQTNPSPVDDDLVPIDIDKDLHLKNLEIYVACLARLSEFTDYEGTSLCLREDARQHPELKQPLIDKLVELANPQHDFQVVLRSAARKVLNNYALDMEGNPLRCPPTDLESVASVPRSAASSMSNVSGLNSQEKGHPKFHRPVDPATRVRD